MRSSVRRSSSNSSAPSPNRQQMAKRSVCPPAVVQPVALDDIAAALTDLVLAAPMNGTVELAGPERISLDELVSRFLRAKHDPRQVVPDVHARYFGAELDQSLTPGKDPRIDPLRLPYVLAKIDHGGLCPDLGPQSIIRLAVATSRIRPHPQQCIPCSHREAHAVAGPAPAGYGRRPIGARRTCEIDRNRRSRSHWRIRG